MVRQLLPPMRIPLRLGADGRLYHAIPRQEYSRFDTAEEAEAAIQRTIVAVQKALGFDFQLAEFELVRVADYEGVLEASEKREKKVKAAKRKKAAAEDELEST
jgi:hypothetical protein